jgi:hypothetical protein
MIGLKEEDKFGERRGFGQPDFFPGARLCQPQHVCQTCGHRNRNTKHQTPNTKEAPTPKLQTPEKLQTPSSKLEARATVWSLELGISLVFGVWCLEL